ncbi:hypothetical protein Ancab_009008 [Ancistrocladus abbreviatus]
MTSHSVEGNCLGWASRDPSGLLSPYKFNRRHEITGVVQEVGRNVDRFKVGDRLGVGFYVNSCRDCELCNAGFELHCLKGSVITFNSVDVDGTVTKGGFSSFIVVHER